MGGVMSRKTKMSQSSNIGGREEGEGPIQKVIAFF